MDRVLIFEDILTAIDAAAPKPVPRGCREMAR